MSMTIKLWGVRGSLPSPYPPTSIESRLVSAIEKFMALRHTAGDAREFVKSLPLAERGGFGGNTLCVEIERAGDQRIIIDAGSGIRALGEKLMSYPVGRGKGEAHILFTHFHWDHLLGLPFFPPIFIPGNTIHLYGVQEDLEHNIRQIFKKPFFPVPFEALGAKVIFHRLKPREKVQIAGFDVTPYKLDHPDPCWGYRVELGGRAYAHCVDTEGTRVSRQDLGEDLGLYQKADLMFFDAQYTMLEAAEKMNWGHSAAPIGLELALREGVKRVLFAHHDPGASDDKIADAERQTRDFLEAFREQARRANRIVPDVEWAFALEGQEIIL
ncbi:MAG: MBL fold metallo-hydrolase [Bdellovibrionota bacterium]